jgi:hypothetical protein
MNRLMTQPDLCGAYATLPYCATEYMYTYVANIEGYIDWIEVEVQRQEICTMKPYRTCIWATENSLRNWSFGAVQPQHIRDLTIPSLPFLESFYEKTSTFIRVLQKDNIELARLPLRDRINFFEWANEWELELTTDQLYALPTYFAALVSDCWYMTSLPTFPQNPVHREHLFLSHGLKHSTARHVIDLSPMALFDFTSGKNIILR